MTLQDAWEARKEGQELEGTCAICGQVSVNLHFELEFLKPICNDKDACRQRKALAHGREVQTMTASDVGSVEDVLG